MKACFVVDFARAKPKKVHCQRKISRLVEERALQVIKKGSDLFVRQPVPILNPCWTPLYRIRFKERSVVILYTGKILQGDFVKKHKKALDFYLYAHYNYNCYM